jgi:hypothetical protein
MKMTWFTEVGAVVAGAAVPVPQEVMVNNVATPILISKVVREGCETIKRFLHSSLAEARILFQKSPRTVDCMLDLDAGPDRW